MCVGRPKHASKRQDKRSEATVLLETNGVLDASDRRDGAVLPAFVVDGRLLIVACSTEQSLSEAGARLQMETSVTWMAKRRWTATFGARKQMMTIQSN